MTEKGREFLTNAWYVIALGDEIAKGERLTRTILDLPLMLWRDAEGDLAVLLDRCPHRMAPLSMGRFDQGTVRCAYHGLAFDRTGRCIGNPHGPVTSALHGLSFPVEECGPLVWVWMGDAGLASATPVPAYPSLNPDRFHMGSGYIQGQANYQLMVDNILDLSHIEFLHPALGTEAVSRAKVDVETIDERVITTRHMVSEMLPEGLARTYFTGCSMVSRELRVEWQAPSLLELRVTIVPNDPKNNEPRGSVTLHLFTPETAKSTHYFYICSLSREQFSDEAKNAFCSTLQRVFNDEDKPMIDAQQHRIGWDREIADLRPALLAIDKAPILARRRLAKLIAEEKTEAPALARKEA